MLNERIETKIHESGVFINIQEKISNAIKHYLSSQERLDSNPIRVKLSADATRIGRFIKIINFTFTILNDINMAMSVNGNYTLGIFYCKNNDESYQTLKSYVPYIIEQVKLLKFIEYKNHLIQVDYFFCADWKMMAETCGLYGPSSDYPCIWCEAKKDTFYLNDISTKRSYLTKEQIKENYSKNHNGYKYESLLTDLIPFNKCIPDLLHLFMRVSEVLIIELTDKLISLDNYKRNPSKQDLAKYPNISKYFHFLNEKCKIKVVFSDSEYNQNKGLLHRGLTGKEKKRIFQNIDFIESFPDLFQKHSKPQEKLAYYELVWKDFFKIINIIKESNDITKSEEIQRMTKNWLCNFLQFHFEKSVTPYIHVFCNHLHEFINIYGNINIFNLEGLEKLNDVSTIEFFKSSNRWIEKKSNFLIQMIQRRSRIDILANDF